MRLTRISIANYRSLQRFECGLRPLTVIIGENDVGKTSVLYALDAFFTNKKLTNDLDYFNREKDTPVEIEVDIEDVSGHPTLQALAGTDGLVRVRRVFPFQKDPETLTVDAEGTARTLQKTEVRQLFPEDSFHFVPVRRSLDDQFSMKKTALLGKTFRALMKSQLAQAEHARTQREICEVLRSAIDPARSSLEQLMREQLNQESLMLKFPNMSIDPVEGVDFDVTVGDGMLADYPLSQRGAGTQNSMILALYRFVAASRANDFILALEEPENSFHPKGQRELLAALTRLSRKAQVICTTHSPVFIDRVDFRNNVILVRQPNGSAVAKSLDMDRFDEVRQLLGIRPSDALLKGGGNCSIIAEGKSEESAFPRFMQLCGVNDRQLGIAVLPVGGSSVNIILEYVKLLDSFGLPCCVILDGDVSQSDKDELRKRQEVGRYPAFKFVHFLHKGCLEDYYPCSLFAEALQSSIDNVVEVAEGDTFPSERGRLRLKKIHDRLRERGVPAAEVPYLKEQLASHIPDWMVERGVPPDSELQELFARVKEIALQQSI